MVKGQGCGELGGPQSASWTGRLGTTLRNGRPLCCFGNFMKKKGRSGTAGGGIAGATAWRHVAADKMERQVAGWAKEEEGKDGKMKGGGERERSGAVAEAWLGQW